MDMIPAVLSLLWLAVGFIGGCAFVAGLHHREREDLEAEHDANVRMCWRWSEMMDESHERERRALAVAALADRRLRAALEMEPDDDYDWRAIGL